MPIPRRSVEGPAAAEKHIHVKIEAHPRVSRTRVESPPGGRVGRHWPGQHAFDPPRRPVQPTGIRACRVPGPPSYGAQRSVVLPEPSSVAWSPGRTPDNRIYLSARILFGSVVVASTSFGKRAYNVLPRVPSSVGLRPLTPPANAGVTPSPRIAGEREFKGCRGPPSPKR